MSTTWPVLLQRMSTELNVDRMLLRAIWGVAPASNAGSLVPPSPLHPPKAAAASATDTAQSGLSLHAPSSKAGDALPNAAEQVPEPLLQEMHARLLQGVEESEEAQRGLARLRMGFDKQRAALDRAAANATAKDAVAAAQSTTLAAAQQHVVDAEKKCEKALVEVQRLTERVSSVQREVEEQRSDALLAVDMTALLRQQRHTRELEVSKRSLTEREAQVQACRKQLATDQQLLLCAQQAHEKEVTAAADRQLLAEHDDTVRKLKRPLEAANSAKQQCVAVLRLELEKERSNTLSVRQVSDQLSGIRDERDRLALQLRELVESTARHKRRRR